jgi:UDP-N-acetylmuramoyl-tripeptide--D-alanyl-D-alanine ligase
MDIQHLYQVYVKHPSVQTDTRKIKEGDLFMALKGPNFNANAFAQDALEKGAAFAVIDEKEFEIPGRTILVDDVLTTLQNLALHHREQFNIPFIAITGSNGKTTTKELIHVVLNSSYKTYTTEGNLNNHIGVPLTILKIRNDAEFAIIEMGANHQKEIESYCQYTLPTHGLITNCGKAHLEGFGGVEGVKKGKGELYDFLKSNNGKAFVMWDYDYLQNMSRNISEIISYGSKNANVEGHVIQHDPFLEVKITKGLQIDSIKTNLVGEYNFSNVLAAVTIGNYFNVPAEKIKTAIENYAPSNSRSQLMEKDGNRFILDAYNANPSSMKAAIENFAGMQVQNKILMLGAMAELGDETKHEHEALLNLIKKHNWKEVVLVGENFPQENHSFHHFETSEQARQWFTSQRLKDAYILIKGSRSIAMEKILN